MWNNNGFQGHGNLQQGQGNFQQNFADDGYIPFSTVTPGQQYFHQQRQHYGMEYNSPATGSQQSMPGDYSPELNLYSDGPFVHNQFNGSEGPEHHVPQRPGTAGIGNVRPTLNARAEELKAQLLRSKERARSGTPPAITADSSAKPSKPVGGSNSFRGSPNTPVSTSDGPPPSSRRASDVMDDDLNKLISDAKAAANVKKESPQNESSAKKSQQSSNVEELKVRPRAAVAEPSIKGPKKSMDVNGQEKPAANRPNGYEINGELSDASEGEILEKTNQFTSQPQLDTREAQAAAKHSKDIEPTSRKPRTDEDVNLRQNHGNQERRRVDTQQISQVKHSRSYDDKYEDRDEKPERRSHQSDTKTEYKRQPEIDLKPSPQRQPRTSTEDHQKHEARRESKREHIVSPKSEVPTLAQLLLIDEDLKDWLDITNYHNEDYRKKILNRRRALAALDAQKAKLLAEIEMEERGGINTQSSAAGMLPPPMPSKVSTVAPSTMRSQEVPVRHTIDPTPSAKPDQETGTKRTYTEYQGANEKEGSEKVERVEDRCGDIRIKSNSLAEPRLPETRTYDSLRRRSTSPRRSPIRRRSPSPDTRVSRRDDRDRSQDHGAKSGRQLKGSPSYEPPDSKRSKTHEQSPSIENKDSSDYKSRPFVQVGNYRGRAYDPNYRGRGRGRGNWHEPHESRFEQRTPQQAQPLSHRIASMKPYKDPKPLDLGSRGDTRYFIVKSFNEENVVRCVEDSIWTTQVENGDIFKTAFLTCKNVILVFSVNQSRAFQGYARMENTPGSETPPAWQKNIHWESAGAFKVKWLCVANTRFHRVGHLKNKLNENQPVLVGRDGQEIEERAGAELLKLIDEEAERLLDRNSKPYLPTLWDN